MYVLESTYHGETSPIQRNKGRWRWQKLTYKNWPIQRETYFQIIQLEIIKLGDAQEDCAHHNTQPVRNWERDLCTRNKMPVVTPLAVPAYQTLDFARPSLESRFCCTPCLWFHSLTLGRWVYFSHMHVLLLLSLYQRQTLCFIANISGKKVPCLAPVSVSSHF
jgi:hypothetical protein